MSGPGHPTSPRSGSNPTASPTATTPQCPPTACPAMEIEINNTPATNDDLVELKCEHPANRSTINCRIRATATCPTSSTVVLTNPDGRLRFPNAADTTRTLTVPGDGSWVAFQISGERGSNAIGDAIIEAHCNTATGALTARKGVTVFWFDQAQIKLTRGGAYSVTRGLYTITGAHAVNYEAKARIRPAGVNCSAPQVTNLRVGIMQDSLAYNHTVTWDNPTITWLPTTAAGTTVPPVSNVMRLTVTYGPGVAPVADTEAHVAPLYDQPGIPRHTLDPNSLKKPIGCQPGSGTAAATSFDTPSHDIPALSLPVQSGGVTVGTVRWTFRNTTRDEDFRTYCVIFNISTHDFCALREANWGIHLDSAGRGRQRATVHPDGPAAHVPLTGLAANDAPHVQNTVPVGTATTTFTRP